MQVEFLFVMRRRMSPLTWCGSRIVYSVCPSITDENKICAKPPKKRHVQRAEHSVIPLWTRRLPPLCNPPPPLLSSSPSFRPHWPHSSHTDDFSVSPPAAEWSSAAPATTYTKAHSRWVLRRPQRSSSSGHCPDWLAWKWLIGPK